jgi:hypothetical protein
MPRSNCPVCGAPLRDRGSLAPGQRARCHECGHAFRGEEVERGPRPRKRRKKSDPRALLIAGLLAFGLAVLAGGVVAVVVVLRGGGNNLLGLNTGVNPKVNELNLNKLWPAMSLDEAQAILGEGKECDADEICRVCDSSFDAYHQGTGVAVVLAGASCKVQSWYRWQNGGLHVFAGFQKSKSGVPRLVLLRWYRQGPGGAFEWMEAITLQDHPFADPNALDRMAADHARRGNLLDDPKWKTGAAIRQSLVGRWRLPSFDPVHFPSPEGYDFNADGSCVRIGGPGDRHPGSYRFVDDSHVEVTTADEAMVLGGGKRPTTRRYRVLVSDKELILVTENPSGPVMDPTLERQK